MRLQVSIGSSFTLNLYLWKNRLLVNPKGNYVFYLNESRILLPLGFYLSFTSLNRETYFTIIICLPIFIPAFFIELMAGYGR